MTFRSHALSIPPDYLALLTEALLMLTVLFEENGEMLRANNQRGIVEYPDYDISGSGQTKTILLLHGAGVTRKMWTPQMMALYHTYRLLAPDLPRHGSRSQEKFTFSEAVAELNNLIEENNYGKVLVVGFSLGGYLASEFVCKYPNKTNGLVLVGSSTIPRGYISIPYHFLAT